MTQPTLVCDLFTWLPSWGEFDLRPGWDGDDFVLLVDYETGEAADPDDELSTKVVTFESAASVVVGPWPRLGSLPPDTIGHAPIDRGQIWDLGATALQREMASHYQAAWRERLTADMPDGYPNLQHYYVYFDDMKETFQAVARSVTVTDGDPPGRERNRGG